MNGLSDIMHIYALGQQGENLSPMERAVYKVVTQLGPQLAFACAGAALTVLYPALSSSAPIDIQRLLLGVALAIGITVVGTLGQGANKWLRAHGDAPLAPIVESTAAAAEARMQQAGKAYGLAAGVPNDLVTPLAPPPFAPPYGPAGAGPDARGYALADLDTEESVSVQASQSAIGVRGHPWAQPRTYASDEGDEGDEEGEEDAPTRTNPVTPALGPANRAHEPGMLETQPELPAVSVPPAQGAPLRVPGVPRQVLNQIRPTNSGFLR